MPPLSMAEAAREVGKSKASIWRAVKSGRLSASRTDDGQYSIDPAELSRAFSPEPPRADTVKHREAVMNGDASAVVAVKDELILELRRSLAQAIEGKGPLAELGRAIRTAGAANPSEPA